MTLNKIRYFLEVARTLNYTRAAENLYMAQPNLSKHIAQMEEEVGVQLFVRTKRSVALTEAGTLLFDALDGIPRQVEHAFELACAVDRGERGRVSIGILEGQELNKSLRTKLERIGVDYPHIEVDLERAGFRHLREGLINGTFDAVITMSFDILNNPDFSHSVLLSTGGGVIAINHNHPLAEKKDLCLSDLSAEDFVAISPSESPQGYQCFIDQCKSSGFEPRISRKYNSLESLILSVEAGFGIALLDHNTRLEHNGEISMISIPHSPHANLMLVWRSGDSRPLVQNLVEAFN